MLTRLLGFTVAALFALASPGFAQPALESPLLEDDAYEGTMSDEERARDIEEGVAPRTEHDLEAAERDLEAAERDLEAAEEDLLQEEQQIEEAVVPGETVTLRPEPTRLQAQKNYGVELEGGVSEFTGDLGDSLDTGGNWGVRGIFGKASPIGLEAAYFGSANSLAATDESAISSAGELQGRLNMITDPNSMVQPFIAAGVNYYRIDTTGDAAPFQGGNDAVESVGFPLSAGVNFLPTENITIGARGNYRILTDLIDDQMPDGDNWNVGLTLGAAF